MQTYCIYKNPSDYPGKFVMRKWYDGETCNLIPEIVADSYEEVYTALPDGAIKFPLYKEDDPAIYETWIL